MPYDTGYIMPRVLAVYVLGYLIWKQFHCSCQRFEQLLAQLACFCEGPRLAVGRAIQGPLKGYITAPRAF